MRTGPCSPRLLRLTATVLAVTVFLVPQIAAAEGGTPGFFCSTFGFILKPLGFCKEEPVVVDTTPALPPKEVQTDPVATLPPPVIPDTTAPVAIPETAPVHSPAIPKPVNAPVVSSPRPAPSQAAPTYVTNVTNILQGLSESAIDAKIADAKAYATNALTVIRAGTVRAVSTTIASESTIDKATFTGDTSMQGALALSSISPSDTTNRLYNSGGTLYWNGSELGTATSSSWTASGANVYRSSGNVGIGTSSPASVLSVSGAAFFGGAAGTTTIQHSLSVLARTSLASTTGKFYDIGGAVCNVEAYGAVGDDSRDNYAAIMAAINACPIGGTVLFPMGVFRISQPITLDKPVTLQGTYAPRWYYASTPRSSIKPTTSFSGTAIVHVRDKSISGQAADNNGGRIRNISIDGNSFGTAIDGLYFEGLVRDWKVEGVDISQTSGNGFRTAQGSGSGNPRGFTVQQLSIYSPALHGVRATALTDSYLEDVLVVGGAQRGFYFTSMGETKVVSSRAVFNTLEGLYIDGASSNGGFQFTDFSTDRNDRHGIRISATGTTTISFTGLLIRRDGANDGGGSETPYAGVAIIGSASAHVAPVVIKNMTEIPGVDDDGTGTPAPSVGIRVEKASYVSVDGVLWGVDQAYSDGGGNDHFIIGEDTLKKVGYNVVSESLHNDKWIATSSNLVYAAGNVGVGTTTPTSRLHVVGTDAAASVLTIAGATSQSADYFRIKSTYAAAVGDILTVDSSGNVGIGTTTMNRKLNVADATSPGFRFTDTTNGAAMDMRVEDTQAFLGTMTNHDLRFITNQTSKAALTSGGKFGIASTSPWRFLSVTGTVGFDGLTAEVSSGSALCLSSDKEVTVNTGAQTCTVSSARFKHDIAELTPAEAADLATRLHPVSFKYNGTDEERVGLIAEEVAVVDGRLVFREEDGAPRGVRYEDIAAVLVGAFKHQQEQIASLLGSGARAAGSALQATFDTIFAKTIVVDNLQSKKIEADEVTAGKRVCIDGVCVTGEELRTLMENAGIHHAPVEPNAPAIPADIPPDEDATTTQEETVEASSTPPQEIAPVVSPPVPGQDDTASTTAQ